MRKLATTPHLANSMLADFPVIQRNLKLLVEKGLVREIGTGPTDPTKHYEPLKAMTDDCDSRWFGVGREWIRKLLLDLRSSGEVTHRTPLRAVDAFPPRANRSRSQGRLEQRSRDRRGTRGVHEKTRRQNSCVSRKKDR